MEPAPSFLIMISSSEKEGIPKDFVSQMDGSLETGTFFLRDQYNNSWPIEISRDGDEWYMDGGWAHFFRFSSLEFGDFMTFEYKGGNVFDFKLYGRNLCLKKCVVGPVMQTRNGASPSSVCNKNSNKTKRKCVAGPVMQTQNGAIPSNVCNENSNETKNKCVAMPVMQTRNGASPSNVCNKNSNGTKTFGYGNLPSKRTCKRDLDCYGDDIFESGLARRPDNPYFVSKSRTRARKNELYIPKEVILDRKLNIPETLFLIDESGIKYEARVKQWGDGRIWCTKGWRDLCKANRIKIDDVCICEFINEEASIRVSVVPDQGLSQGNSSSDK